MDCKSLVEKVEISEYCLNWESILENADKDPYTVYDLLDSVFDYMDGSTNCCTINKDIGEKMPYSNESVVDKMNLFSTFIKSVTSYTTIKGNDEYVKTVLKPLIIMSEDIKFVVNSLNENTTVKMSHNRYESLRLVFNALGRDLIPTANNNNESLEDMGDLLKEYRLVSYGIENFSEDTNYFDITKIMDLIYCLPVDDNNSPLRIRLVDVLTALKNVPEYEQYQKIIAETTLCDFVETVLSDEMIVKNKLVKIIPDSGKIDKTYGYDISLTSNGVFIRDGFLRKNKERFEKEFVPKELFHPLSSRNIWDMLPKQVCV